MKSELGDSIQGRGLWEAQKCNTEISSKPDSAWAPECKLSALNIIAAAHQTQNTSSKFQNGNLRMQCCMRGLLCCADPQTKMLKMYLGNSPTQRMRLMPHANTAAKDNASFPQAFLVRHRRIGLKVELLHLNAVRVQELGRVPNVEVLQHIVADVLDRIRISGLQVRMLQVHAIENFGSLLEGRLVLRLA
jgi:hypothetical protein